MMGWDMGFGWGGMFFGGLMMVMFWGGLLALIVLAVRGLIGNSNKTAYDRRDERIGSSTAQTPLETVKTRYAKGEISKEEYDSISRELQTT